MKNYFSNLSARTWALVAVPFVLVAYPIVAILVPAMLRAVMPQAVRTVLTLI
jgi:hypothetical protein